MLINCDSFQKKFVVPDDAITQSGRLVQCGSCGAKWTQHPIKALKINQEKKTSNIKLDEKEIIKNKVLIKKARPKKNLYTLEYMRKKHGLIINDSTNKPNLKILNNKNNKIGFGFYSYIIFLFIFIIVAFGILNLTKEIIILKYPSSEMYIYYFYEVIEIVNISFTEFVDQFKN